MPIFNYHTHTSRCGHASGSDEDYVKAAIQAGYKILGFSDHAPYKDYPNERARMDWDRLDEYISSINDLKKRYRDQIEIHVGLESEYYPFDHDERAYLADRLEYLILGQHFHHPSEIRAIYFHHNTEEQIREYAKGVCQGLDSGLFLYLAHPDVIMNGQDKMSEACVEAAHMIGKKASELDIPVEINVRGIGKGKKPFENGLRYYYPHKDFWKILAQYPIRCLIGIDAHDPGDLLKLQDVQEAYAELADLDLHYINEPLL